MTLVRTRLNILLMNAFVVSALFLVGNANAGELLVTDQLGSLLLRVDASEGSKFDLSVSFTDSSVSCDDCKLFLKSSDTNYRNIDLSSDKIRTGVVLENVEMGKYIISTDRDNLQIRKVDISEDRQALNEGGDEGYSTSTYALGAVAIAGGVAALGASSDSLGIFDGSSSSSSDTTRIGTGTSTSDNSITSSQVSALGVNDFDVNRPIPPGLSSAPSVPSIGTAPGVGTGPSGSNNLENPFAGNPPVAPAPPEINPMTPS